MNIEPGNTTAQAKIISEIRNTEKGESLAGFNSADGLILDVRSTVEFDGGHIPGAISFPLFTDEERAEVGICYKKSGRDAAIKLGFDYIGPRLEEIVRRAMELAPEKAVRIHCARGGLRSRSMAWLLETAGFRVMTLENGYKSYRRWVKEVVGAPRRINKLGGLTGTGKTRILKALRVHGEQVLDLEGLANHRGSSFGGLGLGPQPTTQHFENLISKELEGQDPSRAVWIESESGRVGTCWVPEGLYTRMKTAPAIQIVRSIAERLDILTAIYGSSDRAGLIEATERIGNKLGGERARAAVELIRQGDIREACSIILDYYDRTYRLSRERRPMESPEVEVTGLSDDEAATLLIRKAPMLIKRVAAAE